MSWNQPNPVKNKTSPKNPIWVRGVIAGAMIVGGALFFLLVLSPSSETVAPVPPQTESEGISAVPKQKPVKVRKAERPIEVLPEVQKPATNQWGNPISWGPNKKLKPRNIARLDYSQLPLYEQLFPNSANRAIAGLLVIEPGTDLIGDDEFGPDFVKSFLQSLAEPIIVGNDDSEEAKALKRAVNETKIELKARYDRGEDIAKIMTETRRELRELGAYRENLTALIDEARRNRDATTESLNDYIKAANKMLEERGCKEIVMPEFYYRQLEMRNKFRKENKIQ